MKTPKLKSINTKLGHKHNHPNIKTDGTCYLVFYNGKYHTGSFSNQWYGLNFDAIYDAGLQFDTPGWNCSKWPDTIYEIVEK